LISGIRPDIQYPVLTGYPVSSFLISQCIPSIYRGNLPVPVTKGYGYRFF
jgi:hypothetical protein